MYKLELYDSIVITNLQRANPSISSEHKNARQKLLTFLEKSGIIYKRWWIEWL